MKLMCFFCLLSGWSASFESSKGCKVKYKIGAFSLNFDFSCALWQKHTPLNHPLPSSEITSVSLKCLVITLIPTSAFGDCIHSCIFYNLRDVKCFSFFCFQHQQCACEVCLKHFKMLVRSLEGMQLSGSLFCMNTIIQLGLRSHHSLLLSVIIVESLRGTWKGTFGGHLHCFSMW